MVENSDVERKTFIKNHDEERNMQSSKEVNTRLNSKLSHMFDFNIHVHETSQIQKASVSIYSRAAGKRRRKVKISDDLTESCSSGAFPWQK